MDEVSTVRNGGMSMNDRYLYRAKRTDDGEWIVGSLIQTSYLGSIRSWISSEQEDKARLREISSNQAVWRAFEVRTDTICQCTGLNDKNGKLIWENDIVKGKYYDNGKSHRHIGQVKYIYEAYKVVGVKQYTGYHAHLDGSYEVIGNIFDNKELLEREDKDENNY